MLITHTYTYIVNKYFYTFQFKNNISFFCTHTVNIVQFKILNRKYSFSIQFHPSESNWIQLNLIEFGLNPIKSNCKKVFVFKICIRISIHFNPFSFTRVIINYQFNKEQAAPRISTSYIGTKHLFISSAIIFRSIKIKIKYHIKGTGMERRLNLQCAEYSGIVQESL